MQQFNSFFLSSPVNEVLDSQFEEIEVEGGGMSLPGLVRFRGTDSRPKAEKGPKGGNLNNPRQNPENRNAPLNVSVIDGILGLHEPKPETATCGIEKEQPWHRMVAWAQVNTTLTDKQIAENAGVCKETISLLNSQLWFQQLKAVLTAQATHSLGERLSAEATKSLDAIVHERDCAESPKVRLEAAKFLFEQANGKAVQKVLSATVDASVGFASPSDEMSAIRSRLEALRAARQSKAEVVEVASTPPLNCPAATPT